MFNSATPDAERNAAGPMNGSIVVVSGPGGVGKSTVAHLVAAAFERSVHLNAAAYTAPSPGEWGTAGRYSITGPGEITLNTSLARTFRPSQRFYLDARVEATNLLNHPVFTGWYTTVNSTQFGLPVAANAMRSLETTLRLRF